MTRSSDTEKKALTSKGPAKSTSIQKGKLLKKTPKRKTTHSASSPSRPDSSSVASSNIETYVMREEASGSRGDIRVIDIDDNKGKQPESARDVNDRCKSEQIDEYTVDKFVIDKFLTKPFTGNYMVMTITCVTAGELPIPPCCTVTQVYVLNNGLDIPISFDIFHKKVIYLVFDQSDKPKTKYITGLLSKDFKKGGKYKITAFLIHVKILVGHFINVDKDNIRAYIKIRFKWVYRSVEPFKLLIKEICYNAKTLITNVTLNTKHDSICMIPMPDIKVCHSLVYECNTRLLYNQYQYQTTFLGQWDVNYHFAEHNITDIFTFKVNGPNTILNIAIIIPQLLSIKSSGNSYNPKLTIQNLSDRSIPLRIMTSVNRELLISSNPKNYYKESNKLFYDRKTYDAVIYDISTIPNNTIDFSFYLHYKTVASSPSTTDPSASSIVTYGRSPITAPSASSTYTTSTTAPSASSTVTTSTTAPSASSTVYTWSESSPRGSITTVSPRGFPAAFRRGSLAVSPRSPAVNTATRQARSARPNQ